MSDPSPWGMTILFVIQWFPFAAIGFTFLLSVFGQGLFAMMAITPISLAAGINSIFKLHTTGLQSTFDWIVTFAAFLPGTLSVVTILFFVIVFAGIKFKDLFGRE